MSEPPEYAGVVVPPSAAGRAAALRSMPPALARALDEDQVLTWREEGVDDTVIGCLSVTWRDGRCYLERVVWAFDEEELRWHVDCNELWELPEALAHQLARRLLAGAGAGPDQPPG